MAPLCRENAVVDDTRAEEPCMIAIAPNATNGMRRPNTTIVTTSSIIPETPCSFFLDSLILTIKISIMV